jgi:hypothetical protein
VAGVAGVAGAGSVFIPRIAVSGCTGRRNTKKREAESKKKNVFFSSGPKNKNKPKNKQTKKEKENKTKKKIKQKKRTKWTLPLATTTTT